MLNFPPLDKTRVNHRPLCKQKMAPTWAQMPNYSGDNESNSTAPALPHLMPVQAFPIIRPFSLERLEPQLLPIFPKLYRALVISLGVFYYRDYSPASMGQNPGKPKQTEFRVCSRSLKCSPVPFLSPGFSSPPKQPKAAWRNVLLGLGSQHGLS